MADVTESLLAAGFVETAFHCPSCGLGGTSLSRPSALLDRTCLDRIARYKRPKDYRFLDALPTNNYGKVVKRELKP